MKKILLAICLLALTSITYATEDSKHTTITNTAGSDSFSGSVAVAESNGVSNSYNSNSDMGNMVGAAIAPALTTTLTETCMGSTSIGAGWSGGGVSFGTTWRDSACVRRLDAREIKSIHPNFAIVAKEMMCDSQKVYEAFKRAGMPCVFNADKESSGASAPKGQKKSPNVSSTATPRQDVASNDNGFF